MKNAEVARDASPRRRGCWVVLTVGVITRCHPRDGRSAVTTIFVIALVVPLGRRQRTTVDVPRIGVGRFVLRGGPPPLIGRGTAVLGRRRRVSAVEQLSWPVLAGVLSRSRLRRAGLERPARVPRLERARSAVVGGGTDGGPVPGLDVGRCAGCAVVGRCGPRWGLTGRGACMGAAVVGGGLPGAGEGCVGGAGGGGAVIGGAPSWSLRPVAGTCVVRAAPGGGIGLRGPRVCARVVRSAPFRSLRPVVGARVVRTAPQRRLPLVRACVGAAVVGGGLPSVGGGSLDRGGRPRGLGRGRPTPSRRAVGAERAT